MFPLIHITLIGLKHSGKTQTGTMIARELGLPFRDLDDLILEEQAQMPEPSSFLSVRELYKEQGASRFKELEERAAARFKQNFSGKSFVLALGGGTCENKGALEKLRFSRIYYLNEPADILFGRIMKTGLPPFLNPEDPRADFEELYQKRDRLCRNAADRMILKETREQACRDIIRDYRKTDPGGLP